MSRVVVYDMDNRIEGEFRADVNRGWAIGNERGSCTITIPKSVAANKWMQFGRIVRVRHESLPDWAGVLNPPWESLATNCNVCAYNIEYLLKMRYYPQGYVNLSSLLYSTLSAILNYVNSVEDTFVRLGDIDNPSWEPLDTDFNFMSVWDIFVTFAELTAMEISTRVVEENNILYTYIDMLDQTGVNTGFLLHDGDMANVQVLSSKLEGEIFNSAAGFDGGEAPKRKASEYKDIEDSISKYRLRTINYQFKSAQNINQLGALALKRVQTVAYPKINLRLAVFDVNDTFQHLNIGNSFFFRLSNLVLPGGVNGWSGTGRITAMQYDESKNSVTVNLEANYGE